jgi:16S rRNA processing protein RimM
LLEVGRIGRAHGVRGELIIELLTDRVERVAPGTVLHAEGHGPLTITASRPHQSRFIVSIDGVFDRSGAEALQGAVLLAEPIDDPSELWAHEVIGRTVLDSDGVEHGVVASVQDNPASDLLVLDTGALVPVRFVVEQRDDVLVVDVPEGLFDL